MVNFWYEIQDIKINVSHNKSMYENIPITINGIHKQHPKIYFIRKRVEKTLNFTEMRRFSKVAKMIILGNFNKEK